MQYTILHFVQFLVWFSIFKLLQVEDMYITGIWNYKPSFMWVIIIETIDLALRIEYWIINHKFVLVMYDNQNITIFKYKTKNDIHQTDQKVRQNAGLCRAT